MRFRTESGAELLFISRRGGWTRGRDAGKDVKRKGVVLGLLLVAILSISNVLSDGRSCVVGGWVVAVLFGAVGVKGNLTRGGFHTVPGATGLFTLVFQCVGGRTGVPLLLMLSLLL